MKKFTIDTSVFLNDLDCLFKFEDNMVIIPSIVWEELNDVKDKKRKKIASEMARKTLRILEELSEISPLKDGVKLNQLPETSAYYNKAKNLETIVKVSYEINNDKIDKAYVMSKRDYHILSCALNNESTLISDDTGFLCGARDWVKAERYKAEDVPIEKPYKGYRFERLDDTFIESFYRNKETEDIWNLHPNEFIIMKYKSSNKIGPIGIKKRGIVKFVNFDQELDYHKMKTKPANLEQKMMLYLLQSKDILAVTITGHSGRGKSLVSCDYAFSEVFKGMYGKFMYTKSIIPVDEDEYMGYVKGSEEEKFSTYIKPLYSSIEYLYKNEIRKNREKMANKEKQNNNKKGNNQAKEQTVKDRLPTTLEEKIEQLFYQDYLGALPLATIRGMNIDNKVVMLDEAQNVKKHVMKSLVSRLTDESKLIVTGDIEQIDDTNLNLYNNGLSHLIEKGKDSYFIAHITLDIDRGDSKRGKLSTFASKNL